MQPGAEAGVASKGVEPTPGPEVDLLSQVVRRRLTGHATRQGVDPGNGGPVQPLEGLGVATDSSHRLPSFVSAVGFQGGGGDGSLG